MKSKNVILITVDCLRADHVGCLGYDRETTPNIDKLAEKGVLFENAIAQGPDSPSSFQAILTSTYPIMFDGYSQFSEYRTMISEVLKQIEYTTATFHGNPYFSEYFGYNRGFDHFKDFLTSKTKKRQKSSRPIRKAYRNLMILFSKSIGMLNLHKSKKFQEFRRSSFGKATEKLIDTERSPSADVITPDVIEWLRENKPDEFFLWVHYMDAHEPTMPPKEYLEMFNPTPKLLDSTGASERVQSDKVTEKERKEVISGLIDLYDAEVRYIDEWIGRLIDNLKKIGIREDTLLIITADHGEQFYEHGGMAHGSLYDEVINVPLIISGPDITRKKINNQVRLLDIPTTILDYLNIEAPKNYLGTSLKPLIKDERKKERHAITEKGGSDPKPTFTISERKISYRTSDWKLILEPKKDRKELYKISEDPEEKENVYLDRKDKAKELRSKIKEHIRTEKIISKEYTTKREKERIKNKIKDLK